MKDKLRDIYRKLGLVHTITLSVLALYVVLSVFPSLGGGLQVLCGLGLTFFGFWSLLKLARIAGRRIIWRLRNRLLVTYLFIAVVPVVLLATMGALGALALTNQLSVYLVTSELDRRVESLQSAVTSIAKTAPAARAVTMQAMADLFYRERFPGVQFVLRERGLSYRYPENAALNGMPNDWPEGSGIVVKEDNYYAWARSKTDAGDVCVLVPLTRTYLTNLVPHLGFAHFLQMANPPDQAQVGAPAGDSFTLSNGSQSVTVKSPPRQKTAEKNKDVLPLAVNAFDIPVNWISLVPVSEWSHPGKSNNTLLVVGSRPSAVLEILFSRKVDYAQNLLPGILLGVGILFLIVELIALVIGVSMTRTITSAVHNLYEGMQRVMKGDFAHRVDVKGTHQLADLSNSFNRMTVNLETLVAVAKEKERLQSEIEIAREVQSQLYPRKNPETGSLRVKAICQPARMVSGDYYDYECLKESDKVILAIGDVAGKGISAALLMATLQSSLRAQLRSSIELAAAAGNIMIAAKTAFTLSTSQLVSRLNQQLHAYTSPEKYATFCFGIYDEPTGVMTYTNAGHLPPIHVRQGKVTRLDVNGTVVGAFARSRYQESRIHLEPGDLMVWFTDGVTEPENAYGEMYGEERLVELTLKNADRTEEEILNSIIDAVMQWTGSPELQDDMTLLIARRA